LACEELPRDVDFDCVLEQINILRRGVLSSEEIKANSIIDKHYSALAASAINTKREMQHAFACSKIMLRMLKYHIPICSCGSAHFFFQEG
jgi:hypothetical protein